MGLKNLHPERGQLISSTDYDDGRLTFVKLYAQRDKDGGLKIECWIYGEVRGYEGDFSLDKEGAEELRKFLNKKQRLKRKK